MPRLKGPPAPLAADPEAARARLAEDSRRRAREAADRANRRRAEPQWWSRSGPRRFAGVLGACVGLMVGLHLWHSGAIAQGYDDAVDTIYYHSANAGLRIEDIVVDGREQTDADAVLAALDVGRGSPMLRFNPTAARESLEKLPWVKTAVVERHLPSVIRIHLVERHPLALWQNEGAFYLVDADGTQVTRIEDGHAPVGLNVDALLHIVGEGAPSHTVELMAWLKDAPTVLKLVKAAVRVGDRRWDLKLSNGLTIRLPETNVPEALARLLHEQDTDQVLQRDLTIIDLRLPDRMMAQPRNPVVAPPAPDPHHKAVPERT